MRLLKRYVSFAAKAIVALLATAFVTVLIAPFVVIGLTDVVLRKIAGDYRI